MKNKFLSNLFASNRRNGRWESLSRMGVVMGILLLVNVLGHYVYTQLDLTEDKRYTLMPSTEKMLSGLQIPVQIEVYLEGDFPSMFKRLQRSTREMLTQFNRLSNGMVQFSFVNPNEGKPEEVKQKLEQLKQHGIYPVNLQTNKSDESKRQVIFPFAAVSYGTNPPMRINLIEKRSANLSDEEIVNNSIVLLEYKFANAIQKLQMQKRPIIAFTRGHGELDTLPSYELKKTLFEYYDIGEIDILNDKRPSINAYRTRLDTIIKNNVPEVVTRKDTVKVDVLVIAKPRKPFTDEEKFEIDQYVMDGGKVLFLLDEMGAEYDTLRRRKEFIPWKVPHNLDDMLMRWGARINETVVMDATCSPIPVVTGVMGGQPQTEVKPWWYHAVLFSHDSKHPIVKALDGVDSRYPSTIDTVQTKTAIKKTVLLTTSAHSTYKRQAIPISLGEIATNTAPEQNWNKPFQPVAVLLEGTFGSTFKYRVPPSLDSALKAMDMPYKDVSVPTKMIVVADGDIAANAVSSKGEPFPLGFNIYNGYTYGNKDFLFNCIEYMLDSKGVVAARTKDFKLRLLDKVRVANDRLMWQFINVALPVLLLILFGVVYSILRRRRYTR